MSIRSRSPLQWNAADYAVNSVVQQSWAREIIARLELQGDEHVLDIGCGDGKVTAEIAHVVPRGSVVGVDAAVEMIRFAHKTFPSAKFSNLKFQVTDARKITFKESFDVVFSNAALHWVDDHEAILRGAAAALKAGGRLLISCGGQGNAHDVFLALRPEMRLQRWRGFFRKMPMPYFFYAPEAYQRWLPQFGFKINVVELASKDAAYEGAVGFATWLRTTWIPFVQRVPETVGQSSRLPGPAVNKHQLDRQDACPTRNLREEFIAAVTQRYVAKHPLDAQGKIHVRMMRLEIDAVKL